MDRHSKVPSFGLSTRQSSPFGATMRGALACALLSVAFLGISASAALAAAPMATCSNEARREEEHATALPDCRAYEMVSPADKNGGDVNPTSYKNFAAADGSAATYSSHIGSDDGEGNSLDSMFLSRRTGQPGTSGWATHSITPPTESPSLVANVFEDAASFLDFSPDLSRGLYLTLAPLIEAPNVARNANLYLRQGLLDGAGDDQLLTDAAAPLPRYEDLFPGETGKQFEQLFKLNNYKPDYVGASTDFSHVVFESGAPLTPDADFPGQLLSPKLKIFEHAPSGVRLVGRVPVAPATSCDDSGAPAVHCEAAPSSQSAIPSDQSQLGSKHYGKSTVSADGSRIFFQTPANGEEGDIYLREDGTKTFQLNASEKEPGAPTQQARLWTASADGSRAFFTDAQQLTDAPGNGLYMYEADKPEGERLTLLSVDHEPAGVETQVSSVIGASKDGSYVYFYGFGGQLVAGDDVNGGNGIYLWHEGTISYIGDLQESPNNWNSPLATWNYYSFDKRSRVSPDGRYLLFATYGDAGLKGRGGYPGYEYGGGVPEQYLYEADSGRLACVTCNPSGFENKAPVLIGVHASVGITQRAPGHENRVLAANGRYVFFSSDEALVPADTNGRYDAYEYDTRAGQFQLLSSGASPFDSYFMDASEDGSNAFIDTRQKLVGWDVDTSYDLYDVRIDGGVPEPVPTAAPCGGEGSCRAPAASPPALAGAASASLRGTGNPKPKRQHPKKRHHRKRHQQRAGKAHHRPANADRRASR